MKINHIITGFCYCFIKYACIFMHTLVIHVCGADLGKPWTSIVQQQGNGGRFCLLQANQLFKEHFVLTGWSPATSILLSNPPNTKSTQSLFEILVVAKIHIEIQLSQYTMSNNSPPFQHTLFFLKKKLFKRQSHREIQKHRSQSQVLSQTLITAPAWGQGQEPGTSTRTTTTVLQAPHQQEPARLGTQAHECRTWIS